MDRTEQINWINRNAVSFILQGGSGDYSEGEMTPIARACYMADYWMENAELPDWWTGADVDYLIDQLRDHFAALEPAPVAETSTRAAEAEHAAYVAREVDATGGQLVAHVESYGLNAPSRDELIAALKEVARLAKNGLALPLDGDRTVDEDTTLFENIIAVIGKVVRI